MKHSREINFIILKNAEDNDTTDRETPQNESLSVQSIFNSTLQNVVNNSDDETMNIPNFDNDSNCSYNSEYNEVESGMEENIEFLEAELSTNIQLSRQFCCANQTSNLLATIDVQMIIANNADIQELHENLINRFQELWKCLQSPKEREALTEYLQVSLKRPVATRFFKRKIDMLRSAADFTAKTPLQMGDFHYLQEYLAWVKPLELRRNAIMVIFYQL